MKILLLLLFTSIGASGVVNAEHPEHRGIHTARQQMARTERVGREDSSSPRRLLSTQRASALLCMEQQLEGDRNKVETVAESLPSPGAIFDLCQRIQLRGRLGSCSTSEKVVSKGTCDTNSQPVRCYLSGLAGKARSVASDVRRVAHKVACEHPRVSRILSRCKPACWRKTHRFCLQDLGEIGSRTRVHGRRTYVARALSVHSKDNGFGGHKCPGGSCKRPN